MNLTEGYKKVSLKVFGRLADRMLSSFEGLKPHLRGSGIGMFLRTWVSIILLSVLVAYLLSLGLFFAVNSILVLPFELFPSPEHIAGSPGRPLAPHVRVTALQLGIDAGYDLRGLELPLFRRNLRVE